MIHQDFLQPILIKEPLLTIAIGENIYLYKWKLYSNNKVGGKLLNVAYSTPAPEGQISKGLYFCTQNWHMKRSNTCVTQHIISSNIYAHGRATILNMHQIGGSLDIGPTETSACAMMKSCDHISDIVNLIA